MVRGENLNIDISDMVERVEEIVHGGRLVFVKFHRRRSRMFRGEDVKKDNTGDYEYNEEEKDEV